MVEEKRSLAQKRIAKGLCPRCGEEAAPYRLCKKHRDLEMVARTMERFVEAGVVKKIKIKGRVYFEKIDLAKLDTMTIAPRGWDLRDDDKRRQPRLGGLPVDVVTEVVGLIATTGVPMTTDEIVAAWGRLRETRQAGSIAGNLTALIAAERRRQAKALKRLGRR